MPYDQYGLPIPPRTSFRHKPPTGPVFQPDVEALEKRVRELEEQLAHHKVLDLYNDQIMAALAERVTVLEDENEIAEAWGDEDDIRRIIEDTPIPHHDPLGIGVAYQRHVGATARMQKALEELANHEDNRLPNYNYTCHSCSFCGVTSAIDEEPYHRADCPLGKAVRVLAEVL